MPISEWPILDGFICRTCCDVARCNPADNREWGCATCNGSSHSVYFNFMDIRWTAKADLAQHQQREIPHA